MRKWYPAVLIAVTAIVSAVAYPRLPETVPSHWNLRGQVNAWQSRGQAALLMPVLMLVLWGVMRGLPAIDPRRANYAKFQPTYDFMIGAVLTLVALIHLAVLGFALGLPISIHRVAPIALGLVLIAIGNQLPRARSNWWFGIRTPWTLSNERVWERTQRVGGYLMTVAGGVVIVSALVAGSMALFVIIACVAAFALGSTIYSYFAWRQETSR
ncbi:MAG TPA: SdpI family protein [Gemmatimonadaceae bacterium]